DEKRLVKSMMEEVLSQFKAAIAEGRNLKLEEVTPYADGRVFTGEAAVKAKLADQVGTFSDAVKLIGSLTGLGNNPELFEPPQDRGSFLEFIMSEEVRGKLELSTTIKNQLKLHGQPLFLMPGVFIE